jgi:hypothetical protein
MKSAHDHFELRRFEHVGEARGALGIAAAGLADDQAPAHVVSDDARLDERSREMDHAADDPLGRNRARDRAARIEGLEPQLSGAERQPVEEPPRDAVHRW